MSYSDLFEQRKDNTRDRVIKHISDKLKSFSISGDLCLVELVFPFLDMYNDLIVIDIEKAGDVYIVSDGIQFGAAIDEHEQHIQAFLSVFNGSECTMESAIQYDSAYGFRAKSSYENLPNVILKMLSFLVKLVGFIEFELIKERVKQ
jgi:hypothetical protein